MRVSVLVIIAFVCLFLQVVALRKLSIGEISPDFALLLCSFFALYKGTIRGSLIGFVVGLFQDLFNPAFLGLNALTKTLIGYAFGHVGAKTVPERTLFLSAVFFLAALGHDFVYLIFFTALDMGNFIKMLFNVAIPSAVYTAVAGIVLHKLMLFINARMVRSVGQES
ncbi:MAG: rod shape-determining protein MreD [Candidatus Latescibacteria bacterium]|nr:rod shape-determining protein MreD [Candidatus Latescibacterota bacterium]NIO27285.1 rod shape-determining protein MreD [Candidatus Latescibacterota bacterium]NIO54809.1 rod shape-determining protein MreD [Candidatus Latescibacterota bacterium]NIT00892.1 rod shape-determining protein MreD [Candidatus Latescibacterota bacterium]NIT37815.1 rod shape-determining protein MreD [Candidatus Latescibacterota bacterium]